MNSNELAANKYYTFCHLLKTSLYYHVKHRSLKMLQLLYHSLMTELSTPPKKFFKNLKKQITLLICCLVQQHVYQSRVYEVEELLDIWHGFQQSAADSAIDGECIFVPAYRPKEDILSANNMLLEWVVIETLKQCSKFVECVFPIDWQFTKLSYKSGTAVSPRISKGIATFLNVSHGSATRF